MRQVGVVTATNLLYDYDFSISCLCQMFVYVILLGREGREFYYKRADKYKAHISIKFIKKKKLSGIL